MSVSIVILAAGQGTRMKSDTPKVLHKISGKEMLFHIIDVAKLISDDITVVLNHQFDRVKSAIESRYEGISIHKQDSTNYPGTGGALKGVEFRDDRVLILNGDMPLITKESLLKLYEARGDIAMSVIELQNPSGYGRVVISEDGVERIVEEKDCSEDELKIDTVNAGVYCIDRELLEEYIPKLDNNNSQKEYYLTDIIELAREDNRAITPVFVREEEFKGVNSKYDLALAEEIMQDRIKKHWMQKGVIMRLPQTIYIDYNVAFEGECEIENGVRIEGESKIISSHIKANSVVEESIVIDSSIGPMAHIRPNSKIQNSHIGNFVEVKKGELNGIKAGHLSYLGDCFIDEGTNIGAGTITCNYDGKQKYQTKIGKNVFVGSDSQLVAPLNIEDDTIIAAGSTITKDIPKGALAISRVPQKIVREFFYKFFAKR